MEKNLTKHNKQPVGAEYQVSDMDSKWSSGNLESGAAHKAPMASNAKREKPHLGAMPKKGKGLV